MHATQPDPTICSADLGWFPDSTAFIRSLLGSDHEAGRGRCVALASGSATGWRELTYADLDTQSRAVSCFAQQAGLAPGDRVVLCAESSPEWVAALLGVWRAGGIVVPVDPKATGAELQAIVDRCTPRLVITDPAAARATVASDEPSADAPRAMSEPALIVWTSGTTGAPKGVTLTFGNIAYDVACCLLTQRLEPTDRWLSILPLHHMLELSCGLLSALASGAEVSFASTLMPIEIVALMEQRRTTHMMTVPLLLRLLRPAIGRVALRPRALFVGGAPVPVGAIEAYADLGVTVYQGYGLTETSPLITANGPDDDRPGSVGKPLPGTQIRVDAAGQLHVRSPAVMAGYWEDAALTREVIADGWFATGDLGRVDAEGFVYVTGRVKNLIVLESGKNVQPEEVEIALAASRLFAEVCVVGVPSKRDSRARVEEVCAVVVPWSPLPHTEASAEVARVTATLSGFKRPTVVIVSDAELPKTAKRSVVRRVVAEEAANRLAGR